MIAARKEVAQFVSQQNSEQSGGKGKSHEQTGRILVEERESVKKFVSRNRFVVSVGDGELSARCEASAQCKKEKRAGKN